MIGWDGRYCPKDGEMILTYFNYIIYIIIVIIIIIYDLGMLWAILGPFGFAGYFDLECGAFKKPQFALWEVIHFAARQFYWTSLLSCHWNNSDPLPQNSRPIGQLWDFWDVSSIKHDTYTIQQVPMTVIMITMTPLMLPITIITTLVMRTHDDNDKDVYIYNI